MKKFIKEFPEINFIIILLSIILILIIVITKPFLENWSAKQFKPSPPLEKESTLTPTNTIPTSTFISPPLTGFVLPQNYSLKPSTSFTIKIVPNENIFSSIYRIEILFDPNVLEAKEVLAGNFFKNPQILRKEINNEQGRVYFSAGIGLEERIATGEPKNKNTLTTINFEVKSLPDENKLSQTTIDFGEKTAIISQENEFENLNQTLEPIVLKTAHE